MASAAFVVVAAAVEVVVAFAAEEYLTVFLASLASQVAGVYQAAGAFLVVAVSFQQLAVVALAAAAAVGLAVAAGKDNYTLTDDSIQPIELSSPVLCW